MKIAGLLVLQTVLMMVPLGAWAVTKCVGPNGEKYFTDQSQCPAGYSNETPPSEMNKKSEEPAALSGPPMFSLRLGMTARQIQEVFPGERIDSDSFFIFNKRVGSISVESITGKLVDGKLDSIMVFFDSGSYSVLFMKFEKDYGAPKYKNDSVVQNRMGAQYLDEEASWTLKDGSSLHISKYASTLDNSLLTFSAKHEEEAKKFDMGKTIDDMTEGF